MTPQEARGQSPLDPPRVLAGVLEIAEGHAKTRYQDLTPTDVWTLTHYALFTEQERQRLDPEMCSRADTIVLEVQQALYGDPNLPLGGGVGGSSRP